MWQTDTAWRQRPRYAERTGRGQSWKKLQKKITSDICDNCEIHGKITASTVKWEYESITTTSTNVTASNTNTNTTITTSGY